MTGNQRKGPPDRFSDDLWEARAAELEQVLAEKNQQMLRLETQLGRRDERLKQALTRLRDAEEGVEAQVQLMDLAGALDDRPRPVAPDVLSTIATQKGQLETRVKRVSAEYERALSELKKRDLELASLRKVIGEHQRRSGAVEAELAAARSRLSQVGSEAAETAAATRDKDSARMEEHGQLQRRLTQANEAQIKIEQARRNAEEQAALYRTNLLHAEESLSVTTGERDTVQGELDEARGRLEHVLRRAETLERRLADHRAMATRRQAARERLVNHLRTAGRAAAVALAAANRDRTTADRDARQRSELQAKARARHAAARTELEGTIRDLERRLAQAESEAIAARDLCDMLADSRLAAERLAAHTALAAEERTARQLTAHGLQPISPLAQQASTAGKVGALLRWIRRS